MRESIVVLYSANDLASLSAKEKMLNTLKITVLDKDTELKYEKQTRNIHEVAFTNGDRIMAMPIGTPIHGVRMTHLFLSKEVFNLSNIEDYISDWCIPNIVTKDMYSGVSPNDRTYVFGLENGLLNVNFYEIVVDENKK
ncbi:hypothetical protein PQE66_gp164 [Bacillus phage PBC2]|uniref:Uncharacterized protein n=1 Tax=Bacillus phage PBC2 TaxID=1675029 RepID=A0A218KC52_9CAUD|nr:hypothetical protein PQE66_gp164 [Bacillus phage PBC2]AKQ08479.1 hypothetical protein PBC2_164 [Bacillus phage PBC2]